MKKLICILFGCLLLSSCGGRYRYTAEDRPPIYGYGHHFDMYDNSLEQNIGLCDLVIEGKVLNNGKVETFSNDRYTDYPMTEFTVRVKDVKYGEAPSRKIKIRMEGRPGEITWKPEKGDRVIMLLGQAYDPETREPTDKYGSYMTFVMTSDGLQTLSEDRKDRTFDGKSKEELYAYIDEVKSVL